MVLSKLQANTVGGALQKSEWTPNGWRSTGIEFGLLVKLSRLSRLR